MKFIFSSKKNGILIKERGIGFENIIKAIQEQKLIAIIPTPNKKKYPNQFIYIVNIEGYAFNVPFVRKADEIVLKTIYPSRKSTKIFLRGEIK